MVSKALVVATYRSKLREIARQGVELTAIVPTSWTEEGRELRFEPGDDSGYDVIQTRMAWNGHYHLHYYPRLRQLLETTRPDILHMDEEPYNLATFLAFRSARRLGARTMFFTWQNIEHRYPPPYRYMERAVLRQTRYALAGNQDALDILRRKGLSGPAEVLPQFGVDTTLYSPENRHEGPPRSASLGGW